MTYSIELCSTGLLNSNISSDKTKINYADYSEFENILNKKNTELQEENSNSSAISTNNVTNSTYSIGYHKSKDDLYSDFAIRGVCTYEDYKHERNSISSYRPTETEYQSEYQEYMKTRGCNNPEEMEIIFSVAGVNSKEELMSRAKKQMSTILDKLQEEKGVSVDGNKLYSTLSIADLQDIADFVNANDYINSSDYINGKAGAAHGTLDDNLSCLQIYIEKVFEDNNLTEKLELGDNSAESKLKIKQYAKKMAKLHTSDFRSPQYSAAALQSDTSIQLPQYPIIIPT